MPINKVFIIAEGGICHNGSLDIAKKMAEVAKDVGADAIKFQTFKTEDLTTVDNFGLKKYEFTDEQWEDLKLFCDSIGIEFMTTCHTIESIPLVSKLVKRFKIASGDIDNYLMLEKVAKENKPIILSTGACKMSEVEKAVEIITKYNKELTLLHCISLYPIKSNNINLYFMKTLRNKFNLPVGFSDHTLGTTVPYFAAYLRADVIEKHFTLDNDMEGPDHKMSLNPKDFKEMVDKIRSINEKTIIMIPTAYLGSGFRKGLGGEERKMMFNIRKSAIINKDLAQGDIITEDIISFKRPGTGILQSEVKNIIGKKVMVNLKKGDMLSKKDILFI